MIAGENEGRGKLGQEDRALVHRVYTLYLEA